MPQTNEDVPMIADTLPALVFLHYFGGSSRSWDKVIEQLGSDFRCIAPDLNGFGDSNALEEKYTLQAYAEQIAGLIAQLDLKRYCLVGHSMGGKVAMVLAAQQRKGLEKLLLLAPSPPTAEPIPEADRARLLAGYGQREVALEVIAKATARPLSAGIQEQAITDMLRTTQSAWRAWLEHGSREDITAIVSRINIPTILISGECDTVIPTDLLHREVVQRLPETRLIAVPDAGHLLPLEAPSIIGNVIAGFV